MHLGGFISMPFFEAGPTRHNVSSIWKAAKFSGFCSMKKVVTAGPCLEPWLSSGLDVEPADHAVLSALDHAVHFEVDGPHVILLRSKHEQRLFISDPLVQVYFVQNF